MKFLVKFSP